MLKYALGSLGVLFLVFLIVELNMYDTDEHVTDSPSVFLNVPLAKQVNDNHNLNIAAPKHESLFVFELNRHGARSPYWNSEIAQKDFKVGPE